MAFMLLWADPEKYSWGGKKYIYVDLTAITYINICLEKPPKEDTFTQNNYIIVALNRNISQ